MHTNCATHTLASYPGSNYAGTRLRIRMRVAELLVHASLQAQRVLHFSDLLHTALQISLSVCAQSGYYYYGKTLQILLILPQGS